MITSVTYVDRAFGATRRAVILFRRERHWSVRTWVDARGVRSQRTVSRRSLTSAQSTARQFIASGQHPRAVRA